MRHLLIATAALLSACAGEPRSDSHVENSIVDVESAQTLTPLRNYIACLPPSAAMVSAHRASSKDWDIPENALSGLNRLIEAGYPMTELDVSGLKDGALFSYHDGVWDEKSTGKGPVVQSTLSDLDKVLLKTPRGKLSAERPPLFEDILKTARGKIYLEVDFKSSARESDVIKMINAYSMGDQVILISYSQAQTNRLKKLAPDMLLSVSANDKERARQSIWLGYDVDKTDAAEFEDSAVLIGRVGTAERAGDLTKIAKTANIVVTSYPNQYDPIIGLSDEGKVEFNACLNKN